VRVGYLHTNLEVAILPITPLAFALEAAALFSDDRTELIRTSFVVKN